MKILLYGLIVFGLFIGNISVEAKTVSTSKCISLSYDMRLTSTNAQTAGQVSMLQSFLQEKGYLAATTPKGYFGTMTQAALIQYQLKTGITPASGFIGSVTREKIKSDSCGNGEIAKMGPKPTIKKVSSSLPKGSEVYVGGEVQITGKDLAGSSLSTTFVYLGDKKVEVRQASSELIWFAVPEIPLGTYKLYVSNENGNSKTFKLKVINSQVVISNEIPILTSVKPSKASGEVDITIKGKNLTSGSTVTLSRDGQSVYTYTNTKASKNGKSLTFNLNLDLPQNIAPKEYKLRVANIMGQSNELDFTIGESEDISSNLEVSSKKGSDYYSDSFTNYTIQLRNNSSSRVDAWKAYYACTNTIVSFQNSGSDCSSSSPQYLKVNNYSLSIKNPTSGTANVEIQFEALNANGDIIGRTEHFITLKASVEESQAQSSSYPPTAKIDFPVTAGQVFTASVNSSVTIVGQFGRGESENGDAVSTTFFFGDGNSQITNQPSNASTGGVASYHTYTEPGRYAVTLVFKTTNKSVTSEPIYIQVN